MSNGNDADESGWKGRRLKKFSKISLKGGAFAVRDGKMDIAEISDGARKRRGRKCERKFAKVPNRVSRRNIHLAFAIIFN